MTLEQLRYFVGVAKLQHLGKAAKRMHISPSAVSHAISKLEDELGYRLFVNQGKNIVLSERGRLVLKEAEELLDQAQMFLENSQSETKELKGKLRIAATHFLSDEIIAEPLAVFSKNNPQVELELLSLRSFEVIRAVLKDEADMGICFSPQESPQLEFKTLIKGQLYCAVKAKHQILSKSNSKQIEALCELPSVLPKAFSGIEVCMEHPMLKKYGLDQNAPVLLYDNYQVAIRYLTKSDAWSFLPDLVFKHNRKVKPVQHPAAWKAPYTVSLVRRKGQYSSRVELRAMEALQSISS